jgi:hypothetical protein
LRSLFRASIITAQRSGWVSRLIGPNFSVLRSMNAAMDRATPRLRAANNGLFVWRPGCLFGWAVHNRCAIYYPQLPALSLPGKGA